MMMINPINQELFDLAASELSYYKLFDYILTDFVSREDLADMLVFNNLVVQVTTPAGPALGGVTNAVVNPAFGATPRALGLKGQITVQKKLGTLSPDRFIG